MDKSEAEKLVKEALWKKVPGLDKVYTNTRDITVEVMIVAGIPTSVKDGAVTVDGRSNLEALAKIGAEFADKSRYRVHSGGHGGPG